jgi:pyruvate,orthophosphate dikinase
MTGTTLPDTTPTAATRHLARPNSAYVVPFESGSMEQSDLLGGKGANLAEMTRLGLPVPPGFIITTTVCREYMADSAVPVELMPAVRHELGHVERAVAQGFGDPQDPLLLSVRSGARFSMPGMMETILDVGLNDETVIGLARRSGEKFAWDCYARLVSMYGRTVMNADHDRMAAITTEVVQRYDVAHESLLDPTGLRDLVQALRAELVRSCGHDLPQDPQVQLESSIVAVLRSWNSDRARLYRREERIPDDLGTAVSVMAMVFGNAGSQSGSGVCFTRDPASGDPRPMGNYLPDAQGEDVVNGSRDAYSLDHLAQHLPDVHAQLLHHLETLERHYRDLCDVEFTVERGRLWILQTRVGKRTPGAAFRIARDLVAERHLTWDEALIRVSGVQLDSLLNPTFVDDAMRRPLCSGHPVSPGAAVGQIALDSATAARWAAEGTPVILVREETSPDDLEGLLAARAVVTSRGGVTSHAAVVARGMGKPCVVGTGMVIDADRRLVAGDDGVSLSEGDVISVDGTTGQVSVGAIAVRPSAVAAAVEGRDEHDPSPTDRAVAQAVNDLLAHADRRRRLRVYANADNGPDAARARRLGAEGIGLCRTEHQLLGERRAIVEDIVLDHERAAALRAFSAVQRAEMREVLLAMDGQDVVIRLLDPPLHEFLPDLVETAMQVARDEATETAAPERAALLAALRRWSERNPMLGLRGVRLALVFPEILEAQVNALAEAFLDLTDRGHDPRPHLMIPLVSDVAEVLATREVVERCLAQTAERRNQPVPAIPLGTMIELPRAALTAGSLAAECSFFSFGTNDLTQTTWGMSRDDAETAFLPSYYSKRLLTDDPFATVDPAGVGRLMTIAIAEGRAARPGLGLGVCGEQGGDPASVHWFHEAGLDYVSCSPPRLCSARLEAGRAAVRANVTGSDTR